MSTADGGMPGLVALLLVGAVLAWPPRSARVVAHLMRIEHRVRIGLGVVRRVDDDDAGRPDRAGRSAAVLERRGIPEGPDAAAIADALELMALVLGAGSGVIDALEAVARTSPAAVREDLTVVAAAVRWGMSWPVAWNAVGAAWAPARRAMALADAAGVAPAASLRAAAADLRAAQLQQVELAAARLGVTIVLPLGLAFLPAFVLLTVVPLVVALAGEVWG
jgi:pilus assembly protein TadC